MNRPIEFRAWDEAQQYMAYQGTHDLETIQSFMFHFGDKPLMQFTGLHDHDGKKIYSKDYILQNQTYYRVEMCVGGFKCIILRPLLNGKHEEGNTFDFSVLSERHCKVIGNTFENKELLKIQ